MNQKHQLNSYTSGVNLLEYYQHMCNIEGDWVPLSLLLAPPVKMRLRQNLFAPILPVGIALLLWGSLTVSSSKGMVIRTIVILLMKDPRTDKEKGLFS